MLFTDYIKERGDEACAQQFGVKVRTVASWRRAENYPRTAKAREIVALLGGLVSMGEIYAAEPKSLDERGAA